MATVFLYKVFFYKIIPTYIFNSLNCCLGSVIYDVHGASSGLSVMGSRVLGVFGNLTFINTEINSLFLHLLIFFLSSNCCYRHCEDRLCKDILMESTTLGKLHFCVTYRTTHLFCTLYWLFFFIVINTYIVLWIFLLWLTYIYFLEIDHCEEKLALWYIVKCDSIEWLFTDYFCLIIWYSTGSCLSCCYFCNDIRILF